MHFPSTAEVSVKKMDKFVFSYYLTANMRTFIVLAAFSLLCAAGANAQTRRIMHRSHSGNSSYLFRDEASDNFGISSSYMERRDSIRALQKADSVRTRQRAADSTRAREKAAQQKAGTTTRSPKGAHTGTVRGKQ